MSEPHDDHDDLFGSYDDERRRTRKDRHPVQDLFRRAFENTVESVQNTGALPKEVIGYLLQQGDKGRRELVKVAAKELGDFLRATDISSEVVKVLTTVQMDMTVSVRFKRNEDGSGVVPEVETNTTTESAGEGASSPTDAQRTATVRERTADGSNPTPREP